MPWGWKATLGPGRDRKTSSWQFCGLCMSSIYSTSVITMKIIFFFYEAFFFFALLLISSQFPMPRPPLLANVSIKEGPCAEILQSIVGLLQGLFRWGYGIFLSTFGWVVVTVSLQSAPKVPSTQPCATDSGKYVDVEPSCWTFRPFPCSLRQTRLLFCCVPGVQGGPLLRFHPNTSGKVRTGAACPPSSASPSGSTRWQQITWTSPTASCTATSTGRWQTTLPKRTKVGLGGGSGGGSVHSRGFRRCFVMSLLSLQSFSTT